MSSLEQFSLRWNNFHSNLSSGFHDLLREEQLVDVTLATEGRTIKAHQVVLSVCSPFFRKIFQVNPCQHPVVILSISFQDLRDILTFIYQGEVNVRQEDLTGFLKAAELLQIKGLTGDDNEKDGQEADEVGSNFLQSKSEDNSTLYQNASNNSDLEKENTTAELSAGVKHSNSSVSYNGTRKKKRLSSPNEYSSQTQTNRFPVEHSADSTSEQQFFNSENLDRLPHISDSNDQITNKSTLVQLGDVTESEDVQVKLESDVDDMSNNYVQYSESTPEKENGCPQPRTS